MLLAAALSDTAQIRIGMFAVMLISIALHESAHAYAADALGDTTPRSRGRVTLNPASHLHWLMSVVLPGYLVFTGSPYFFGAGRPVPVDKDQFRNPGRDFMLVAVAGPLTNIALAVLFTVGYVIGLRQHWIVDDSVAQKIMHSGIRLNLALAIFNLIPIPPLDGSRLVAYLLPDQVRGAFYRLDPVGFLVLIGLVFFGVLDPLFTAAYVPLRDWWVAQYVAWSG